MFESVRRRRRTLLVAALALATIACGGGSSQGATSAGEGPSQSQRDAAKSAVDKARGPVKFIAPGPAFDAKKLQGKSIWIISADLSIPFHQNIVKGFEDGAQVAGLKSVKFDGKGQTQEFSRGIEQAVAAGAVGIALISIDTRFVSGAIQRANAAHVPVIGVLNTDARAQPDPGTAGEATIDYTGSGELLAAYAIANTDAAVHGIYTDVSEFRVMGFLKNGIIGGFQKYCASACSIDTVDMQMANFKNQAQTLAPSEIRRKPTTNWVFAAFDAQALFEVPSIKAGGFDKVRLGSINAVTANLQFIQNDNLQVVDVGNSNSWLGWAAVDRLMRATIGQPAGVSEVPVRLFDKSNLKGVDINDEEKLFGGADFRSEYKKLWSGS